MLNIEDKLCLFFFVFHIRSRSIDYSKARANAQTESLIQEYFSSPGDVNVYLYAIVCAASEHTFLASIERQAIGYDLMPHASRHLYTVLRAHTWQRIN